MYSCTYFLLLYLEKQPNTTIFTRYTSSAKAIFSMKYERESRPREMKRTHAISDMEILKMVTCSSKEERETPIWDEQFSWDLDFWGPPIFDRIHTTAEEFDKKKMGLMFLDSTGSIAVQYLFKFGANRRSLSAASIREIGLGRARANTFSSRVSLGPVNFCFAPLRAKNFPNRAWFEPLIYPYILITYKNYVWILC